jgi:hypothetical protein
VRRVEDSEVDRGQHDAYLAVIVAHADSVGDAMLAMAQTADVARRSLSEPDVTTAAEAMEQLGEAASDFLRGLSKEHCPDYMRGANDQLEEALRRIVRAGQQAAAAATAHDGAQVFAAGNDMAAAHDEILTAAQRITSWRSGAARPIA